MRLSLIIPTYNGAHKVVHALDSILIQERQPDEVIVVIDGSTDGTKERIQGYKEKIKNFKIIEQANQGRAVVRNTGAKAAQGELLFFLDDDMIMPCSCVAAHEAHHLKLPGTLVSGRLDQKLEHQDPTEFDVFETWQNTNWNKKLIASTQEEIPLNEPYITANNFSIARADFMDLGMLDERLKDAEDYDLAVRAKAEGKVLYLSNNCWAWHNDFSAKNFKSYIKRMRQYNQAQWALIHFKPEYYGNPQLNARYPKKPKGLKALFFNLFVGSFFINSLDKGFWRFLPIPLRCKLYDYIITANGTYYPRVSIN